MLLVHFLILSSLSILSILSFNFDLHYPILFHDQFDKSGSHFGAALALVNPKTGPGWIVIGAPKADSPQANYSGIQEPGLVWKCSLGLDKHNKCSLLHLDAVGELDVKLGKVPRKLIHKDRKEQGMLGAGMYIGDSDRFVTCSSRWVNQKYTDLHLMNGLCYWIHKENLFSPNSSIPDFSHRLAPLLNSTRQAYNVTKSNGSPEHRFDWAFGQAGFSVHLTRKNELLIGAPGILEWAGSVIEYRDAENVTKAYRRFNSKQKDPTFSQVRVARAQAQVNSKVISYFEYFGYAVTSGNFFRRKSNMTQYAGGAPRGNTLSGKVLLFTFEEDGMSEFGDSLHLLVDPLEGSTTSHFASYFGSVLGALDVNGDGLDDLLVGAPLYEDSRPRYSSASFEDKNGTAEEDDSESLLNSGDEGCVFLYTSLGEDFGREPQQICGESRPGARFGSSISPLGDLNYDGFEDVAIGAPYEGDGRGAVYIYVGSAKGLILTQKLSPETLGIGIRGFGYALSGAIDIDQNGYPDLAVGAYVSNHAVIYRSIPVVNITGNLSTPVGKLKTSTGAFPVTSCLRFNGVRAPEFLDIWIKLSVDTEIRKTRIVEFVPDHQFEDENYSKGVLVFRANYSQPGTCYTFSITTVGDLDSVTLPVTVKQEFWLEADGKGSPTPLIYQIKRSEEANGIPSTIPHPNNPKFEDLRKRQPLHSSLSRGSGWKTISIPIAAICEEDGDPNCLADLSFNAVFRTPEGDFYGPNEKFVIGSAKSLILQVELLNTRERANLPLTVDISWQSPPTVRNSRSDCKKVMGEEGTEHVYTCSLPNPLTKAKKEVVELELDMSGIYAESAESVLTFRLSANTSSALVKDPSLQVQLPLARKAHLLLLGRMTEASYYENITTETVNFTHVFEVGVVGQSPVTGIKMHISIPSALRVDGKLLPLLRIREPIMSYEGSRMTCKPLEASFYRDPSRISYEDQDELERRKRRDTSRKSKGRKKGVVAKKPLKLSCLSPMVDCLVVECEALLFKPSYRALVEFRLRLLTQTARLLFSEQEREVFVIESLARVSMLGAGEEEVVAVSQTLVRSELPAELKAWILIVATGGGLLLLSVITIILTQSGFFRRRKLEELQALMAQQEVNDHFELDELEELYDYDPMSISDNSAQFQYPHHLLLNHYEEEDIYDELD